MSLTGPASKIVTRRHAGADDRCDNCGAHLGDVHQTTCFYIEFKQVRYRSAKFDAIMLSFLSHTHAWSYDELRRRLHDEKKIDAEHEAVCQSLWKLKEDGKAVETSAGRWTLPDVPKPIAPASTPVTVVALVDREIAPAEGGVMTFVFAGTLDDDAAMLRAIEQLDAEELRNHESVADVENGPSADDVPQLIRDLETLQTLFDVSVTTTDVL